MSPQTGKMPSYHPQQQTPAQLPQPSAAEVQHSGRLIEWVVDAIHQNGGMIRFSDYMNHLLYAPGMGYYSAGLSKFGKTGDFVTSPEISPLFGWTLGNQCAQLFAQGCARQVLEFGAGSGKLCEQILTRLGNLQHYFILELSADLRMRQQTYLQQKLAHDVVERISWLERLPDNFNGIILANEVLDAMPVHRLRKQQHWYELGVSFDDEKFHWCDYSNAGEAVQVIEKIEQQLGPYADGYTTEVNLNYLPWLKSLNESTDQVVILLIDYGYEQSQYYHPARMQGTLLCHYHHHAHDNALILPGLQDITASVDFDALAEAALVNGFEVVGLVNQAPFLFNNGLLEAVACNHKSGDTLAQLDIARQVKTLTLPGEMGERFKVMGLTKHLNVELSGFNNRQMH